METLKDIQKKYMKRIKRDFASVIEGYISEKIPQMYIRKALNAELTSSDYKELRRIGSMSPGAKYRYLNWLCCIYIHPLTIVQHVAKKVFTLEKELNN